MKRIITYLAALTALVLTVSCSRESMQDTSATGDAISIQVVWSEIATRSAGVDNENAVNSLDWYFFKDPTAAAVFHFRETEPEPDEASANAYTRDFVPGESYGGKTFPRHGELCMSDGYCTVFVVANLPEDKVLASPTLEEIKSVEVDQTFLSDETVQESDGTRYYCLPSNDSGLSFVMTGEAKVKGTTKVVAEATAEKIDLSRLAVKISYSVKVLKSKSETKDGTTETWTPMLSGKNVRMYPQGAFTKALLGVVDGEHYMENLTGINFASVFVSSDDDKWAESGNYYETTANLGPYYSYPNNWEDGGADTFVKIIVPWQVVRTDANGNVTYSAQREVYYKVLLPDPKTVSNTWYQLEITLEPGTENEPEVEVNAKYKVAKWMGGGEDGVNGFLKDIKYLIADRSDEVAEEDDNHFVTYTRGISIPYSASNPVIFRVIEASYKDFSTETPTEKKFVSTNARDVTTYTAPNPNDPTKKQIGNYNGTQWENVTDLSTIESWFSFDNGASVGNPVGSIVLNHWINSDLTSPYFDASPYTFTVRIYLQRDPENYVEELKIVQYPQTYIDAQESTVRGDSGGRDPYYWGYIFINGSNSYTTSSGGTSQWTQIYTVGSTYSSSNHNMYILTTAVVSDESTILGDPRTGTSTNSPQDVGSYVSGRDEGTNRTPEFVEAPATDGTTRSLKQYYPADPLKSPDYIAPKLRISSAFGRRGGNNSGGNEVDDYRYNYASAWNRCAAYQEDGYPAGRWRLPTQAEINYVNTLANRGFIPQMFYSKTTPYWSATPGTATQGGEWVDVTQASTRCVYDDWYWGSEPVTGAQNTFMWGD